jgi:hypothetical protein
MPAAVMVSKGYNVDMVTREIPAAQQMALLGLEPVRDANMTKAATSISRRLVRASMAMARSMVDLRNSMVVSCACSPAHHTVYGTLYAREWPYF